MGGIFLRASHGVRRNSAGIHHPGMAGTEIPTVAQIKNSAKNKYAGDPKTYKQKNYKQKIANDLSCRALIKK